MLLLNLKLVKPGVVCVVYRKDTVRVNGSKIGSFSVYVDHQQVYYENNIQQTSWVFTSFEIDSGTHTVYFEYKTLRSESNPNPHAYISTLFINGTSYSAEECYGCLSGAQFPGATSCNPCDFNQYLQEGGCLNCSDNTYSLKGAVGSNSCKPRLACTENDYIKVFSPCINNYRQQSYQ